ncbi:MAG: NGG1p interacting factor NIF3 [Candidatus Gracilibacteria bacterium]|jgi:putative NIF3 family GTP cyclohydrolase 1 type 2|nr:NGG1p interacting factor NIF3 [Candidatus Gracilibacteria bacterium]
MIFDTKMQNLGQLFDIAVELGVKNDPRGKKEIQKILTKREKSYKKLDKEKKKYFDTETLHHIYSDSRILYGKKDRKIKKIIVGIDMETPELLLANELNKNGQKIDAIMAHHPEGRALLNLTGVMDLQETIAGELGVPINIAEKLLADRVGKIDRALHADNIQRNTRNAELLDIPYFNTHTPADNCAYQHVTKHICNKEFDNLGEIVDALMKIDEYRLSAEYGNPPVIISGSNSSKPGKIVATGFTGGTSGNKDIYEHLSRSGVGTILTMHMSEDYKKEAEKHHINVIVCSHMASDSLGMNYILDEYEKKGIEIIPCSGMIRVSRI